MKAWIDTDSGTWGTCGNDPIRVVDLDSHAVLQEFEGDPLAFLESASDGEISDFGQIFGHRVIAYEWVNNGD